MKKIITKIVVLIFCLSVLGTINSHAQGTDTNKEYTVEEYFELLEKKDGVTVETLCFTAVELELVEKVKEKVTEDNVNMTDVKENTLLSTAISKMNDKTRSYQKLHHDNNNITKKEIEKGKESDSKYTGGFAASATLYFSRLYGSYMEDNIEIIEHLINMGAVPIFVGNSGRIVGRHVLHNAAKFPENGKIAALLIDVIVGRGEVEYLNLPLQFDNTKTVLHSAILNDNTRLAKYLIDIEGVDINIQHYDASADYYPNCTKNVPLHYAVLRRNETLVEYLAINKGIDINVQDGCGNTPLHLAITGWSNCSDSEEKDIRENIAKILIDNGAVSNIKTFEYEKTQRQLALDVGATNIVKYIDSK